METVKLPGFGATTTRLGFGCSGIVGGMDSRRSLHLLETAYDAGIRHFDVAPMYGFGTAEHLVGRFLQGKRANVTVTTKYGLVPQRRHSAALALRSVAKRLLPRSITSRRAAESAEVAQLPYARFTAREANASLAHSLQALRTDRIDLFLLHEVTAAHLHSDELLHWLEDQVQQGSIGAFGVASTTASLPDLERQAGQHCNVIQSEWSLLYAPLLPTGHFRVAHRAIHGLRALQRSAPSLTFTSTPAPSSTKTADRSNDPSLLPSIMLAAAVHVSGADIVLFSSSDADRIRSNVVTTWDAVTVSAARHLAAQCVASNRLVMTPL